MRSQLLRAAKKTALIFLLLCVILAAACKKEVTEVSIDAFAQLNNEVKFNQGTYNILFTLQEYPYKEVGVKIGTVKSSFSNSNNVTPYTAYLVGTNRYGIFINGLIANKTYYYQIYVNDSVTSKVVSSDIFSFVTNP